VIGGDSVAVVPGNVAVGWLTADYDVCVAGWVIAAVGPAVVEAAAWAAAVGTEATAVAVGSSVGVTISPGVETFTVGISVWTGTAEGIPPASI
jgi:hypothetical protein